MITLVWNDVPTTQLVATAQRVQRLADKAENKEEAQQWARAAIQAAAAIEPIDCNLAPFQSFAEALAALADEKLLLDAADALAKHPQALFALAAVARQQKWEDLANSVMARCLAQTSVMAWPEEFPYQQQWKQEYEEQLVGTLLKVWKKRASRSVAKEAVSFATEADDLDAKQVEEGLKALLTPADLWPRPVQRRRPARGKQAATGRSRSGGRRPASSSRAPRSSTRSRTTRKTESDAN